MTDEAPVIALLGPYSGSNLGDAAIMDAAMANLRARRPKVELSGISLSTYNMQSRHGARGLRVCCTPRRFYAMSNWAGGSIDRSPPPQQGQASARERLKSAFPSVWSATRRTFNTLMIVPREISHFVTAWREMRHHDLLVICGSGQIDDEWGGAWGHPFAIFKWSLAAKLAGTPSAVASVGATPARSKLAALFFGGAMRLATYRSFRDAESRAVSTAFLSRVSEDPIVADLAFSTPDDALGQRVDLRARAGGRLIVAISPIAFARPGSWPTPDPAVYTRYLEQMRALIEELLANNRFLLFIWSSMPDDRVALAEILEGLGPRAREALRLQSEMAAIEHGHWRHVTAALQGVDAVVASRLHSVILSMVVRKPVVAVSFDPKVDQVMRNVGDAACLLDIHDFTAAEVLERTEAILADRDTRAGALDLSVRRLTNRLADQYDDLLELASGTAPSSAERGRTRTDQRTPVAKQ